MSRCSYLAALAAVGMLLAAAPAMATFPGHNGRIAFYSATSDGNQIFTVRPNGKDLRQLTHVVGADAGEPDWSPDGRLIAFDVSNEDGASVAIMNADGSNVRVLAHPDGVAEFDPSFTPDGRRLVFPAEDFATGTLTTWTMNLDGSDRRLITPAGGEDPNVSPNGRLLAFLGFAGGPPGALMTSAISGGPASQLTPFSFDVGSKLDWSPDGSRLGFIHNANFASPGDSANIATIRADGTDLRFITHYTGRDVNAFFGSYSPDGRWIVFRLEDHGRFGLYKMRPDGSHLKAILPLSGFAPRFIDWGARPASR